MTGSPRPAPPRYRRPARALARIGAVAVSLGLTAGCGTGPVPVTAAPGARTAACAAISWPATVAGAARVSTSTDSPAVAAWGEPAIIARCGVSSPGPTSADCIDASGVDWVARPLDDGTAFVTYGRSPAIEVLVPRSYAPEPLVLGAFARAAAAIPQGDHRCR